jgi:RNA polymerase sigma-70 factor (ECF subfamily)
MENLIQECVQGNRKAQRLLFEKYAARMMAICLRYIPERGLAEDLLQEGFIKVFDKLHTLKGENIEPWMKRIFINEAINTYHRKYKVNIQNLSIDSIQGSKADEDIPIDNLSLEELKALINALPAGCKLVFNLFAVEGYSHDEIAEMLQISTGTSKSQFHRARKLLQASLAPHIKS